MTTTSPVEPGLNQNANIPVILGGARTPFGRFRGGLTPFSSSELGAHAIRAALDRAGVAPNKSEPSSSARSSRPGPAKAPRGRPAWPPESAGTCPP